MTAAEAALAIRRKVISPLELLDACLARIERVEARVQAWAFVAGEPARLRARRLSDMAARGELLGPLHGVPFGAKDIFWTEGIPTEAGSKVLAGHVPAKNAAVVDRLNAAGAFLLGKTQTTEFAHADVAPTGNPWRLTSTPGGSSSGSAAAVAARTVPLSIGSQTGGSNLRPASYCGIVGMKPSFGRISRVNMIRAAWSLDHVGLMAASVEDVAMMLQAVAGHDPRDPASALEPVPDYVGPLHDEHSPRIGLLRDYYFEQATAEMRAGVEIAIENLSGAGTIFSDVFLPESFSVIHAAHFVTQEAELADAHAGWFRKSPDLYRPLIRGSLELGALIPASTYLRGHRIRRQFRRDMIERLRSCDVLAMPTTERTAPDLRSTTGDWAFQSPWSAAGLPSLTLPCGLAGDGMPMGLQLVAAPFQEQKLLQVAAWCERRLGRLPPPVL